MKKTNFIIISTVLIILSGCGTNSSVITDDVVTNPENNFEQVSGEVSNEEYNNEMQNEIIAERIPENLNLNQEKTTMDTEQKQSSYTAVLHTSEGDITIKLNDDQTPKTVENFVTLAKKDFYNGVIFHRVIKGFMIQGGDPTGTGAGGPGYRFDDEPFTGEYDRGTVAMANAGPNTNGSQFFIMHADVPLPKAYTIFGHVTDGMDTVDKIATAEVLPSGEGSSPVEPVKIESVDVVEE